MSKHALRRQMAAAVLMVAVGFSGHLLAADTPHPGITNPSEQRGLNFNTPGVVSKVFVKEGDVVKKGDLVAQQDDSVDVAELKVKDAEAKSSVLQIDAAKADLAQKKVELDRDKTMFKKGVLGLSDLDKAQLDVTIGDIRVKLAEQETIQKQDEADAARAKVAQKKMLATIDGIVQKINVHEGELATNDPKTPCLQIVSNMPLFVEVDLLVSDAKHLKVKQKVNVRYPGESKWRDAEITFFNPVANAAAGTQRVRLQLDNAEQLRSGLQIDVAIPDEKKDVAAIQPAR